MIVLDRCFGIAGVIRNAARNLEFAFGEKIFRPYSITDGELQAIREGISISMQKKYDPIEVASDSFLVVQAVTSLKEILGFSGVWVDDIQRLLEHFSNIELFHVR